ncbi:hypothetical protein TRIP_E160234 [uncultured Spirochaetota bacterium]|uniref:Uncharacterized protein n=1 Tax=uncultured Spirochaetota bacterium TaxID=460511 RepID=A0A652ZT93_9SPIR|nr:hypothetical protein TRIP_E160234 [uncultured Spirochaetota bacterium]
MNRLEIRPGENPADPQGIRLMYVDVAFENVRIIEAHNDHGKKTVIAEITYEEIEGGESGKESDIGEGDGVRTGSVVEPVESPSEGEGPRSSPRTGKKSKG